MRNRMIFVALILALSLMNSGCWDRQEIEELAIVAGIAIDRPQNETPGKDYADTEKAGGKQERIAITHQYAVPKGLGGGEKGGASQKKPYSNASREGNSIYQILRDFYNISSRIPNYEHLRVILIGEEAARSFNLYKLLNAFLRHPQMPRSVIVMIAEGTASPMLEIKPEIEEIPAFQLNMMARIKEGSSKKPPALMLGDISEKMAARTSFAVQRVEKSGDTLQAIGAAIIRGEEYKLAGWLNGNETDGLNWLMGKAEGGAVEIIDDQTGETIVCRIYRTDSKITPKMQNSNLSFTAEIEAEVDISEDWLMTFDASKKEFIEKVEKAVEKEVKDRILKVLEKIQKEYKADVAGFGKQLGIKYPGIWSKIKDGWDERFSNIPVEVKVKIHVRSFGRRRSKT